MDWANVTPVELVDALREVRATRFLLLATPSSRPRAAVDADSATARATRPRARRDDADIKTDASPPKPKNLFFPFFPSPGGLEHAPAPGH